MEEQSAGQVPPARARHLHGTPDGTPVLHQHRQRLLFQLCRTSRGNPAVPARGEQTPPLAPTHKSQCLTKPREDVLGGIKQRIGSLLPIALVLPRVRQTDSTQFATAGKQPLCLQCSLPNDYIEPSHKFFNFQPVTLKFQVDNKHINN